MGPRLYIDMLFFSYINLINVGLPGHVGGIQTLNCDLRRRIGIETIPECAPEVVFKHFRASNTFFGLNTRRVETKCAKPF